MSSDLWGSEMRFEVRHATRFLYEGPVSESQNELRACPTSDEHQQLLHYHVSVEPPSRTIGWSDYWGTRVDAFGVRGVHEALSVVTEATVETRDRPTVSSDATMSDLTGADFRDEHFELLQHTKTTRPTKGLSATAAGIADGGSTVVDVVDRLSDWTSDNLDYRSGATFVGTTVAEALEAGAGVCQDLAHVAVAACRSVGIPARYVSGYLFTSEDEVGQDVDHDEVVVQTHAWFEAAVPGAGWIARDPTNRQPVGQRHIVIGRARDYHDLAPLRGSYTGPDAASLEVEVHLRRLAAAEQQQQ